MSTDRKADAGFTGDNSFSTVSLAQNIFSLPKQEFTSTSTSSDRSSASSILPTLEIFYSSTKPEAPPAAKKPANGIPPKDAPASSDNLPPAGKSKTDSLGDGLPFQKDVLPVMPGPEAPNQPRQRAPRRDNLVKDDMAAEDWQNVGVETKDQPKGKETAPFTKADLMKLLERIGFNLPKSGSEPNPPHTDWDKPKRPGT